MPATGKTEKESADEQKAQVDNSANASAESETPIENNDSGTKKKYCVHWTCSVLQGDDDTHSGFGFPTLYANKGVELGPVQHKKAEAASIAAIGYRLREWDGE